METRNVVKTVITISYKMIIFALVVILIYYAGGAAFRFGVSVFNESSMSDPSMARTKTVIPDNPSIEDVAQALDKAELIDGTLLFRIQAALSNYSKYFVGGTFELNTGMKPTEIMAAITEQSRAEAAEKETK